MHQASYVEFLVAALACAGAFDFSTPVRVTILACLGPFVALQAAFSVAGWLQLEKQLFLACAKSATPSPGVLSAHHHNAWTICVHP